MNSLTDQQLLRDYAEHRLEAAFAELVRRHVDLIYSAALRMVCDSRLAEAGQGPLRVGGYEANADYPRCFPKTVLKALPEHAVKVFAALGCRRSWIRKVHDALNAAWNEFWKQPQDYARWERQRVNGLLEA